MEVHELALLPDEVLQSLFDLLHLVEAQGVWPELLRANMMAPLPKPDGGRCTVAKTRHLYRMWCGCRKDLVQVWEADTMPDWDTCKPGFSALAAGFLRVRRGLPNRGRACCCKLMWHDQLMTNLFDHVDLGSLCVEAQVLGFPGAIYKLASTLLHDT